MEPKNPPVRQINGHAAIGIKAWFACWVLTCVAIAIWKHKELGRVPEKDEMLLPIILTCFGSLPMYWLAKWASIRLEKRKASKKAAPATLSTTPLVKEDRAEEPILKPAPKRFTNEGVDEALKDPHLEPLRR